MASEWHPIKNTGLKNGMNRDISTPDRVTVGSNSKVWWLGKYGHEWQATVWSRVSGTGCPYCSGRFTIIGETDLSKKELCVETGHVYNSIREAQHILNIHHVSDCCQGKRETAGGYHWRYYES